MNVTYFQVHSKNGQNKLDVLNVVKRINRTMRLLTLAFYAKIMGHRIREVIFVSNWE